MSNLSKLFEGRTPTEVRESAARVITLMKKGDIKKDTLSIRDIAESTLGSDAMREMGRMSEDADVVSGLRESVDPVNLRAFTNITQLLVLQGALETYKAPEFIGQDLVTAESSTEDNTRTPGLAPIDDDAMTVLEGEEFKDVKFSEDYIDVPTSVKRGLKIGVTREMIFFDKTGRVTEMAQGVGDRLGTNKEKRILRVAMGISNTFSRKGTARNTYVASADPRINKLATNELIDWTDIDNVMNLFTGMTDDRATGEPIVVKPDTMWLSPYKVITARRIMNATEVREVTNTNTTTIGGNPIIPMKILSSPWIDWLLVNEASTTASNAKKHWWMGQPKKAFVYRTLFPFQVRASGANDQDEFDRDVVLKFRADERGVAYIKAPWNAVESYEA